MSGLSRKLFEHRRERQRDDREERPADPQRRHAEHERGRHARDRWRPPATRTGRRSIVDIRLPATIAPTPTIANWPSEICPFHPVSTTRLTPTIAQIDARSTTALSALGPDAEREPHQAERRQRHRPEGDSPAPS